MREWESKYTTTPLSTRSRMPPQRHCTRHSISQSAKRSSLSRDAILSACVHCIHSNVFIQMPLLISLLYEIMTQRSSRDAHRRPLRTVRTRRASVRVDVLVRECVSKKLFAVAARSQALMLQRARHARFSLCRYRSKLCSKAFYLRRLRDVRLAKYLVNVRIFSTRRRRGAASIAFRFQAGRTGHKRTSSSSRVRA